MAGSTQNQQRIVGRSCCFGRVGPVIEQQRVVDQFMLIWSIYLYIYFFTTQIFWAKKLILGLPGFLWHPNPTRLGLQG